MSRVLKKKRTPGGGSEGWKSHALLVRWWGRAPGSRWWIWGETREGGSHRGGHGGGGFVPRQQELKGCSGLPGISGGGGGWSRPREGDNGRG